jgi:hypothetical protein
MASAHAGKGESLSPFFVEPGRSASAYEWRRRREILRLALFHLFDLATEILMRGHQGSQVNKGAHDRDVDALAAQYVLEHGDTLLAECVGPGTTGATPGRN